MKKSILILISIILALSLTTSCTTSEGKLGKAIAQFKATLPQPYGEGMTCTDVTIEKDVVLYHISVDERKRMASLQWDEESLRQSFNKEQDDLFASNKKEDEEVKQTYRMFMDCKKGLAFIFSGESTGYQFMIKVPYEDLERKLH